MSNLKHDVGLGSVEIDSADVVRLVLQYLKETGLAGAAAALEDEAGVRVNAVVGKEALLEDIRKGKWAEALPRVAELDLPAAASADVWEHVVRELVDAREPAAARDVARGAAPLVALKGSDPERSRRPRGTLLRVRRRRRDEMWTVRGRVAATPRLPRGYSAEARRRRRDRQSETAAP